YYMEAELGRQTQNFYPTHYVYITAVEERTHEALLADTLVYPDIWPLHDLMRKMRGREHGCKVAERSAKSYNAGAAVTHNRSALIRPSRLRPTTAARGPNSFCSPS